MGENTKIEWAHHTFNPWWGCTKVSPGCAHCYAETLDARYNHAAPHWGKGVARRPASETVWAEPPRWNRVAAREGQRFRVFCASMADVFDAEVPTEWRTRLWHLIRQTAALDWMLLTKRPQNIAAMLPPDWGDGYANVWLGTTCEDQARAIERVPHLLRIPARVRFLSCEPLIGAVDLEPTVCPDCGGDESVAGDDGATPFCKHCEGYGDGVEMGGAGWLDPDGIHWVIAGGESGHGARPMHPDWVRSLQDQCARNEVAFLFKQWGEWSPIDQPWAVWNPERLADNERWLNLEGGEGFHGEAVWRMRRIGKKAAGRALFGVQHDEVPQP